MPTEKLLLGETTCQFPNDPVEGQYIVIDGESYYQIKSYTEIRPFFMSLVSHSDHWLFASSTGGLSAGRRNEDSALFPYYTDDKIAQSAETTGSKTIVKVQRDEGWVLWEPFSERLTGLYKVQRNLYKNFLGNKLIFEEINMDLGLTFSYAWQFSEKYGLVKRSNITNVGDAAAQCELLDGIQNIMPYGVSADFQLRRSNLATAYKKNELDQESGLGIFVLSSMIVDKAEPSEALKATTVWSRGIGAEHTLLSSRQLDSFRRGMSIQTESNVRAENGAYFIHTSFSLPTNEKRSWSFAAEVNQDHSAVISLITALKQGQQIYKDLLEDVEQGSRALMELVGKADGLQLTGDPLSVGRHYSNVLFNIMRGGIFDDLYAVEKGDLLAYVSTMNGELATHPFFVGLPDTHQYSELIEQATATGDADIIRLCYEYLPLTFSRRHGDPSRPWNKFSIDVKDSHGAKVRNYQGNWRDIFQNWEALGLSFPEYVLSMITKFVNASTIDGYNPYRITRSGIDWEVIEPDDPWSYIGYWGDHQIIYLLKLMELAESHYGDKFGEMLAEEIFVYANVPYRIKSHVDIVKNPQDTIDFDDDLEETIAKRVAERGADGKFVMTEEGQMLRANLTEKLLVTFLAKMYNFIPEGGIWLNTQRPEWNDANNALVGNGVSMVTLYYLRRFVTFLRQLYAKRGAGTFEVHAPVAQLFRGIFDVLSSNQSLLQGQISDQQRRQFIDALGKLGEHYRQKAYGVFDEMKEDISTADLESFFGITLKFLDHTIAANRRSDGLYHSYNLIQFDGDTAKVDFLYEMLEGQVAVLSAGVLDLQGSLAVLDALKNSAIYREDQYSYMLYPDRDLSTFLNKNNIPAAFIEGSALAKKLLADGDDRLLSRDVAGGYHFNGTFNNAESLKQALSDLRQGGYEDLVDREYDSFLQVFEEMFNHRAFTGRSGTFFGYEGLGSIYWHMVSKLLLATQENIYWNQEDPSQQQWQGRMIDHYYEIRAGIGINKSPALYGSFPTDPYSHTPGNKGAQQPGMTGQVKEDVINRWAELGVRVTEGKVTFRPIFLNPDEFLTTSGTFKYFDMHGDSKELPVLEGQLAFTYCQIPVIYEQASSAAITLTMDDGSTETFASATLSKDHASEVFTRSGKIAAIKVQVALP